MWDGHHHGGCPAGHNGTQRGLAACPGYHRAGSGFELLLGVTETASKTKETGSLLGALLSC